MNKASSTLIAAVAALALSGSAYAQNNTLATPTTKSPAATNATSGYGTPGATTSDSGMAAQSQDKSTSNSATSLTNLPGSHNTLATPSTKSPAGQ
ncbi:hypothetical protein [Paraburkholderia susongensis]|uniref:Uncharacterized protein n=1 Tax=Paraburkholderia susongensis TaxID=1515439 RepID=A0A1X7M3A6_9BURK|nr:hypothetical protein [Paraburkholderia susongensis]SMG60658.1 hypothetical protein SAMN06265784_11742 [Paraburkholderia susongensis]